jgi:hypothetical protein
MGARAHTCFSHARMFEAYWAWFFHHLTMRLLLMSGVYMLFSGY